MAVIIFLILFITSPIYALSDTPHLVTSVHDGDTVSIKVKSFAGIPTKIERVRLIGIDAPELSQEPWGRRAKKHLKDLLSKSDWIVHVELDVEQRDRYGRILGYLWNRRTHALINEQMLENGYAVLYTVPPNVKYSERFTGAQQRAYSRHLGIWGRSGLKEYPSQWRNEHPSYH